MNRIIALSVVIVATFALSACERSEPTDGAAASREDAMPGMQRSQGDAAAAMHMGEGTLNSIDTAAGTVNISHGPVASANWPAMTMTFKLADPGSAAAFEAGDRVKFQFTVEGGMSATVTKIEAAE